MIAVQLRNGANRANNKNKLAWANPNPTIIQLPGQFFPSTRHKVDANYSSYKSSRPPTVRVISNEYGFY
jgi:hypothetical protein